MEIAPTVRECLTNFKALLDHEENQSVEDEYGRFRIWVGNISAHRTGRRSLEYRLRDSSNLQATVTSLLKDLLAVLEQLQGLAGPERLDGPEGDRNSSLQPENLASDGVEDEDAALFGLEDEESSPTALFEQTLDEAHEVITCLLRFSMTLRNPARHDQLKQAAATTTKHFEPHDINHVREKFPTAPSYLHTRLGKAIAKQRQYFKYREEHHLKLAEGLDEAHDGQEERPSTIATSLKRSEDIAPPASTIGLEGETESVYTATSFAPTTAGDASLRPPPLPEAGREGDPFECPLCYGIIVAEDQRSWRQHVYEDLPPYVCTFEHCVSADHRYSRRRDWHRHQAKFHNRHWLCPFGCAGKIVSEADFHKHLAKNHDQNLDTAAVQRMADACAVTEEPSDLSCPLCKDVMPSAKRLHKHLGHHLEQFALHALPQHVLGEWSDEEDAEIVDDSDEEGISANDGLELGDDEVDPDARKAPITFTDALGKEHVWPFYLCKTWKGMEVLIRNLFSDDDSLGEHVSRGHFDFTGPDGEIIMPRVWNTMIKPGWQITMHMWPPTSMDRDGTAQISSINALADEVASKANADLRKERGETISDGSKQASAEQEQSSARTMASLESGDNSHSVERRNRHATVTVEDSDDERDSLAGSKAAANAPWAFAMDEREETAAAQRARDVTTSSSAQEDNENSRLAGENQTPDDSGQLLEQVDERKQNAPQQLSEAQMNEIMQSVTQEALKNMKPLDDDKEVEEHPRQVQGLEGDGNAWEAPSDDKPKDSARAANQHDTPPSPHESRREISLLDPRTMPASDDASSGVSGLSKHPEPLSRDVREKVRERREKTARQALEQDANFKPLSVADAFVELVHRDKASVSDQGNAATSLGGGGVQTGADAKNKQEIEHALAKSKEAYDDEYLEAERREHAREQQEAGRDTRFFQERDDTSRPTRQPRWGTPSETSDTTDVKGPDIPDQPLGKQEMSSDRNAPAVATSQPDKGDQRTALDAESKAVRFKPSSTVSVSRPLTNEEEWSIYHFETHASQCNQCFDPRRVSRDRSQLCSAGTSLAHDIAAHLTCRSGVVYSTTREGRQLVRVDMKQDYTHALGLLRSMDYHVPRVSRSSHQEPIITYGSSQAGHLHRRGEEIIERERRRNEAVIVEPAESGKSSRPRRYRRNSGYETVLFNEDGTTAKRGESDLVVEFPRRERVRRYIDASGVEVEVADSRPGRDRRYHVVEVPGPPTRRPRERRGSPRERRESF